MVGRAAPADDRVLISTGTSCCAEFLKVCQRTAVGFVVMGFIGFFVKLLFIVSNQPLQLIGLPAAAAP